MAEASVTLHRHLEVLDQRDKAVRMMHLLAFALKSVEENPTRLKTWHKAYDAIKDYESLCWQLGESS
jgi:hypothetical protein